LRRLQILSGIFLIMAVSRLNAGDIPPCGTQDISSPSIDIGKAWSGFPVEFALFNRGPWSLIGYYDGDGILTIALWNSLTRQLSSSQLPERLGWDSHNGISVAIDELGYLHVAANMHDTVLTYYVSSERFSTTAFHRVEHMTGVNENSITYPRFFETRDGRIAFQSRFGRSGSGGIDLKIYDAGTSTWTEAVPGGALLSGQGRMSPYPTNIELGPDGNYHVAWVWRDTPAAETSHDIYYAWSTDLAHWQSADGSQLYTPVSSRSPAVVDRVPPGGGVINGLLKIGFDSKRRVILSYHKYDREGNSQIFNARFVEQSWMIRQISSWKWRWPFKGLGSFGFDIAIDSPKATDENLLEEQFSTKVGGKGTWLVDPDNLRIIGVRPFEYPIPLAEVQPRYGLAGAATRYTYAAGESDGRSRLYLRWESLPLNRDRPLPSRPRPSELCLLKNLNAVR